MKSLKEQLKNLKAGLPKSGSNRGRDHKPPKIGFVPPASWLAADQSVPKKDDGSKKGSRPTHIAPSMPVERRTGTQHRNESSDREPFQQATLPSKPSRSADKTSSPPKDLTTTPFRPHIDKGCPLTMPEWSDIGRSLQHPERRDGRTVPMVVRLGIDFGSAFTKVAIRAGVDLVPVEWTAVTSNDTEMGRYVVPGVVARPLASEYCWQSCSENDVEGNLKLPVIETAGSNECPASTVAYLALVIRYARAFLYQKSEIGRKLIGRSLRWELNIGCPTKPHENLTVVQAFRRIARTAWQAAAWEHLYESDIKAAWNAEETAIGLETEPGVVPEFVAQIAGYLASPQVSEGLHALIDIGAATLDVATFNIVMSDGRASLPRIPIFFSSVQQLGTHYLRHNRHFHLDLDPSWNDAMPVEAADEFGKRKSKPLNEIVAADEEFAGRVVHCITGVVDATRTNTRGDPCSPAWREGLPIFVTGGGSKCVLYRQAIEAAQRQLILRVGQRPGGARHFRLIELNPTSGNALHIEAGDRLTVAFGLTEDAESIARVVPHRDIEAITQGAKERVDQTELYGDR